MAFPAPASEADVITFQPWDAYVIVEALYPVGAAVPRVINLVEGFYSLELVHFEICVDAD